MSLFAKNELEIFPPENQSATDERYIQQFLEHIGKLDLSYDMSPIEHSYTNPVLIVVDAVLSMNRNYNELVVPRLKIFQESGPESLHDLLLLITTIGHEEFCRIWKYNHLERVRILEDLVKKFLMIQKEFGIESELEALRKWGKESKPEDFVSFQVRGIGFTTFQYLRILCGANTIKPDVHISRAVYDATGKKFPERKIVTILEQSADRLGVQASILDHAIWQHYSKKAADK